MVAELLLPLDALRISGIGKTALRDLRQTMECDLVVEA
jgi:hypothetical protein